MFPMERASILNTIAHGATGQHFVDNKININHLDENAIRQSLAKA